MREIRYMRPPVFSSPIHPLFHAYTPTHLSSVHLCIQPPTDRSTNQPTTYPPICLSVHPCPQLSTHLSADMGYESVRAWNFRIRSSGLSHGVASWYVLPSCPLLLRNVGKDLRDYTGLQHRGQQSKCLDTLAVTWSADHCLYCAMWSRNATGPLLFYWSLSTTALWNPTFLPATAIRSNYNTSI
jgi:hypothetical protein